MEHLLCPKHYVSWFTKLVLFNFHKHLWEMQIVLVHGWETYGSRRLRNLPKPTCLTSVRAKIQTGCVRVPGGWFLLHPSLCSRGHISHDSAKLCKAQSVLGCDFQSPFMGCSQKTLLLTTVELSHGWVREGGVSSSLSQDEGLACHSFPVMGTDIQGLALNLARGQAWDWILFLLNAQKPEETERPFRQAIQGGVCWYELPGRFMAKT